MENRKILVIDNYDSFTYNLVQYFGELGADVEVHRNDKIEIREIVELAPDGIVLSPGPGVPAQAGITKDVVKAFNGKIPILGVCLGHQSIGEVFGGEVVGAPELRHGKVSPIYHEESQLFQGIASPFEATRYHSLIVKKESLPANIRVTAWTADDLVMGLQVEGSNTFGIQFHPESVLTPDGKAILENFLCCRN